MHSLKHESATAIYLLETILFFVVKFNTFRSDGKGLLLRRTNTELDSEIVSSTEIKIMDIFQDIHGATKLYMSRWNNKYFLQHMMNRTLIRTISLDIAIKHIK